MPKKMKFVRWATTLTALCAVSLLPACQDPQGRTGGRVGITDTTASEAGSRKILPAALIEFSDQVPRELVTQLSQIPQISQSNAPVTVILGDMSNHTQNVSTNDFEMMARRIRNNLINSDIARNKLTFVQERARVESIATKEMVVGADGAPAQAPAYQADASYALIGDFYRVTRRDVNQYYMEFQLVSFATNQIVFSDRFDVKQERVPR